MIASIISGISADMIACGITFTDGAILLGEEFLHQDSSPPRIVMIPDVDEFGERDSSYMGGNVKLFHPIATRIIRMEAHIWGRDFDEADNLINQLYASGHHVAAGVWRIVEGAWNRDSELAKAGREYVALCEIKCPVMDANYIAVAGSSITPRIAGQIP